MTVTDTGTITADAASARTCGLGCELSEGHEGLHDDLLGGEWDDGPAAALRELAEENADLRDQLAEAQRSVTLCIRVMCDLIAEMYPDGFTAAKAAEEAGTVPDTDNAERLELLGVMDPDDMRTSLAWLISHAPQMFDFALVRDLAMTERLMARLNEGQADDEEPYCETCGATIGVFHGRGDAWLHYTGQGTAASPVDLFDAGHEPVIAWRLAGAR